MKKLAGLIVVMMLGACGGSGDDQVDDYKGKWLVSGDLEMVCPGVDAIKDKLMNETWEFTPGTDADLISVDDDNCNLKWDLVNKAAVLRGGQKCVIIDGDSKLTLQFEGGSFSTPDGRLSSLDVNGSNTVEVFGKGSLACTFTLSLDGTRP